MLRVCLTRWDVPRASHASLTLFLNERANALADTLV